MIHLDQLIATLMQVVIENAGAEIGTLVLMEEDQLTVMAQCSGSRQCDLEKFAVTDCATIPVSVIHLVERTQETLVFDDAVSESSFSTDPYIQHQQTRSLLCMPIVKQNQLIGILYLENNLSTGVFTSDRLQVLKLLIAQAAISLENARLYERLSDYSETLERKVEERAQALQKEIAERQQTEAALRQSEANYRNLLQTANSIIIRYDTQGRIRYINDYGVKLLGYEEHQIVGRTVFETIIPDIEISGRDVKPFVHDLLRNPQSYPQGEGENLCRDGRRVWVVWSNQAIFNEQGEVVEILSVGNDTTQRRQAEEALQRSEAKFRTIFENSQVGIFRNRICDGLILDANQRFANLYGFDSPEEMIGLEHTTGYYVNQCDREQGIELLKRDGEVRSYEVQMRKRDGTPFWGLFSSYLNADDDYIEGVIADISAQKQAEAALRQSEANYRNLLQTANSVIIRYDPQGRIRYINDYGVKLLGYEEHEILGRTVFETIIPEAELSGRDIRPFVHNLLRDPQSYPQTDGENLCRDGRRVWIAWSNQAIFNEQGEVVEILSVGNDTTQRRQAEEALQRSEAKFRAIFENSQVGIFRTRLSDGLILNANQRYANLLGFDSPEEIIGLEHSIGYFVNPSDRQQAIEVMKRDGELRSFEVHKRKRDGTVFWGLSSAYLNADDDYIEGVIADISDRKQAEAALQTSEERLRLALTASNQGLYDIDLKTEERIVNPEYALMLGYNPATFHETISEWIARLHPDDRESVVATYRAYIAEEIPNFQVEYRQRTQDGQWKWTLSVGKIVTWNESGEPIRALGVVTDIDDRKQAEEVLRQSEAQFREQAILSAFRADVDSALAQSDSLPLMLHRCAEAVVKHLNAAFARIWTINKDQNVLELQASAGMYTRLDGTYSRVSMNSPKLGRIAQESFPLLINNVFDDSYIDHEWAEREGIAAFAGCPILLDEQLVGVIAMFARQSIPVSHCEALGFAAREMALGIKRKQAEAALQASEAELRALFSAIPDPLCIFNAEGQLVCAIEGNPSYGVLNEEEYIGKTLHQLYAQEQADEFLSYIQQVLRTQQVLTVEYSKWIAGREIWFSARIAPIPHEQVIWIARDITLQKQAEAASILEERNRMAREIHDTLAQAFTGILIQVDAATQVLTDDVEATQAHLDTIEELARTGLSEARRSVTALRPQLLEEGDLSSALERLVNQMRVVTNTALIYSVQGTAYSLPTEVENNLLRIGQEALTNAIKYANANEIRIELVYDNAQCRLQVKDDGQGFGVVGVPMSGGFGLLGMSERAERIGAQLAIESQPGQGTEIIVIVNRG